MTPETLIANLIAFINGLMPIGGTLAAVVGIVAYGYGKAADSPGATHWAKNAWLGALVLFGGTAVVGLLRYAAGQIFGGG